VNAAQQQHIMLVLLIVGVAAVALALFTTRFGGSYACLFCGTKTGEHDSECPWR